MELSRTRVNKQTGGCVNLQGGMVGVRYRRYVPLCRRVHVARDAFTPLRTYTHAGVVQAEADGDDG